jgi:hypothetical protein
VSDVVVEQSEGLFDGGVDGVGRRRLEGRVCVGGCVGCVQFASDVGDEGLAEFGRRGPATVDRLSVKGSRWQIRRSVRVTVKDTPEHPITTLGLTRKRLGDVDDLLGVVILDGVVAGDLDKIVANDTLTATDQVGLLVGSQLLSGLVGRQHLKDLATVVVRFLVERLVVGNDTGVESALFYYEGAAYGIGDFFGNGTSGSLGRGVVCGRGGSSRGSRRRRLAVLVYGGTSSSDGTDSQRDTAETHRRGGGRRAGG